MFLFFILKTMKHPFSKILAPVIGIFMLSQQVFALEIFAELNPVSVYQTKDGELNGYFYNYVNEIIEQNDIEATIRAIPWKRAYVTTLEKADTAIFPTARTNEREDLFKWVGPIGVSYWSFFKQKHDSLILQDLEQVQGVGAIGVVLGSAREAYLRKLGLHNIVTAYDHAQLHTLLLKQRVRLIASSEVTTLNHLRQKGAPLDSLTRVYDYRTCFLYLALNKSVSDERVDKLQAALDRIKQNGLLQNLRVKDAPPLDSANQRSLNATLDLSNNDKGCF